MDEVEWRSRAASFGEVAAAYAAHRPTYPEEAVRWLVGDPPARVLELGAGTGKLTAGMCAIGHDVVATEPLPEMLALLPAAAPRARPLLAAAEDIPLPSSSVDIVVAGQAWHWFDHERALPEIARVLKPGGTVALVWNVGDLRVPWVRKVLNLTDVQTDGQGEDPFSGSDIFTLTERKAVKHWQTFRQETLVGYVASTSRLATATPEERDERLAEAARIYDSYDRGPDGLLMPWTAYCYRGRVAGLDRDPEDRQEAHAGPDDDETVVISFS